MPGQTSRPLGLQAARRRSLLLRLGALAAGLAALTLLAAPAAGGETGRPPSTEAHQDGCRRCKGRGVKDCPEHDATDRDFEGRVLFCSVAAGCEDCGGTMVIDCDRCDGGPESAAAEARRAAIAEWMERSEVAKHFERNVPRCEADHFELVLDVAGKFKIGRKKIDGHRLMHLVADDTSFVADGVAEHFQVKPEEDYFAKMRMWMWPTSKDHVEAVRAFMNTSARGDFKLLGRDPVFSVWQEPGLFATAQGIRTVFTHNAGHMLISNMFRELDISPHGGGWLDAGLGHWHEYARFDRSVQYCIEEATALDNFSNGVWRAAIRKMCERAASKGGTLLPPLFNKTTTSMTAPEQAICWSFYDWLVAEHPSALRPILMGLKQKTDARELLKEHLGMSLLAAEEAWREWVSSTYPKKEKTR